MNLEEIRALAAIVKENGLESLTLSEGDWHLSIKMPTVSSPTFAAASPDRHPLPPLRLFQRKTQCPLLW